MTNIAFYVFGFLSVIASFVVITRRQPVTAVMWLLVLVLSLAGLFFTLQAQFLGVMQIFLYGDAITVIFIFIIMAMNIPEEELPQESLTIPGGVALLVCASILSLLLIGIRSGAAAEGTPSESFGSISRFAEVMFQRHLLAFEAISILLLVAIIGVVVLSRKNIDE